MHYIEFIIGEGEYEMKDRKSISITIIFFLLGIIIGFLIAPIKKGIGNNCGNNNYYTGEKDETSEEA